MEKPKFSILSTLVGLIDILFLIVLPIPIWLVIILAVVSFFLRMIFPLYAIFLASGWIWAYIYVLLNIEQTGWTIAFIIMLLIFAVVTWLKLRSSRTMPPLERPHFMGTKAYSVIMWSSIALSVIADIAMLIYMLVRNAA